MRPTTQLAIASVLALSLLACDPVQLEPGVPPRDAPAMLARAICPKAYDCCMAKQLMGNDQAGTDVTSCEMKTQTALSQQVATIEASERQGRVNYDGTKVQTCIDTLTAPETKCSDLDTTNHLSGVSACSSFLEPKVAVGGACTLDFECVDGFCDTTGVAAGADGACRALGKTGDSCANMGRCEAGLMCDAADVTCKVSPAPAGPPADACFYSSACNMAGGDRGAASALAVALLALAIARRRR
jgi:uncharacterized protein (TIGR03382 family)